MSAVATEAEALAGMLDKLPPGWAWTRDPGSNWGRFLTPAAAEQVAVEQSMARLLIESTPDTAVALLPDYERVLGPDPCLGPVVPPLAVRQANALARWTERGGASRAHFVAFAAALGVAIGVTEFAPARVGQQRVNHRLYQQGVIWTWRVDVPAGTPSGLAALLECQLRRRAPARTTLVMSYEAPMDGP